MTCYSPLIDDMVNRYTHVSASIDDLVKKAEAGTFTAKRLGTCIYRCVGYDAFHALASTTWEMDQYLGTVYYPRFLASHGIGGGLVVTIPSLKELKNPDVKDTVEEFYIFGSEEPTENIMKVHKLLQHWAAGLHGVGTWHGACPVMAQKIMLQRAIDFDHEKKLVEEALNLKVKRE